MRDEAPSQNLTAPYLATCSRRRAHFHDAAFSRPQALDAEFVRAHTARQKVESSHFKYSCGNERTLGPPALRNATASCFRPCMHRAYM